MDENKERLKLLFESLQKQMLAELSTNRLFIDHSGTKGDSIENVWIEWLRKYLPTKYCVDKAIIIDSNGNISHQIDLVIYDEQFTPFVFNQNGVKYIPAEGIYAVFEIKPAINKAYIEYAGEKIASVRKLHRTATTFINGGRKCPPRGFTKILGGILTISNGFTKKDNKTLEKHLKNLKGLETMEMGCIIDLGCFIIDYQNPKATGEENDFVQMDMFRRYYSERQVQKIIFSSQKYALVSFFLQLTRYLQQAIGTIPAIDLNAYAHSIDFKLDEYI
ncbi:MAG: hypothetical protein LBT43_22885 [Prevotella sp.]|jgi:hypothetical protein|nr:hypothetical protein [Prevotella sp.]